MEDKTEPAHKYISSLFDAMLLGSGVELEIFYDISYPATPFRAKVKVNSLDGAGYHGLRAATEDDAVASLVGRVEKLARNMASKATPDTADNIYSVMSAACE